MRELVQITEHRQVRNILDSINGEFFKVTFIKRTTGKQRTMICRKGVKRHLRGGEAAYNFRENGLVSVWDTEQEGYRCIPVENVLEIRTGGVIYRNMNAIRAAVAKRHETQT